VNEHRIDYKSYKGKKKKKRKRENSLIMIPLSLEKKNKKKEMDNHYRSLEGWKSFNQ